MQIVTGCKALSLQLSQATHKDLHNVASTIDSVTLIPSRSDYGTQKVVPSAVS